MDELSIFVSSLFDEIGQNFNELSIEQARSVIYKINSFLFTTYPEIGTTTALDTTFNYFSDFHKYWERNYREIINATIDETCCEKVADSLHNVYLNTNGCAFSEVYDTCGLSPENICRIRFLTANQDFRGSRSFSEFVEIFNNDNSLFDERVIVDNPENFTSEIGLTGLSQSDKRVGYAKNIAKFLIENNTSPFGLLEKYDNDVLALKNAIICIAGGGYGNKKADMFIRDMIVLGIWSDYTGFDNINVASDVNTIKVALRTGILKTAIPLLSSFLDIFCYQYGYIDDMSAMAWRKVWEIWNRKYPNETIASPSLLDYFVYNVVGKQFCKEILFEFRCETNEHSFSWHSPKNRTCQICYSNGMRGIKANVIRKTMPCLSDDGYIAIRNTSYIKSLPEEQRYDNCPFSEICSECDGHYLNSPKSISILGQTGWNTAYVNRGYGGGGLMA